MSSNVMGGLSSIYVDPGCIFNWGQGMLNSNPLLVYSQDNIMHLNFGSPCIDAGNNFAPFLPETDCDGEPRIAFGNSGGTITQGSSSISKTGWPKVDIGADEYVFPGAEENSPGERYHAPARGR